METIMCKCIIKVNGHSGLSQAGGPGGHVPPHFLADQLTLSQPGGAHYPHLVLRATPDFQTLRRPWYVSKTHAYRVIKFILKKVF